MKFPARALCSVLLFAATAAAQTTYNTPLQHVIMIIQENRTVDNVFGSQPTFEPGVNVQNWALSANPQDLHVYFDSVLLTSCYDLGHGNQGFNKQWDHGLMDGAW